MDRVLRTSELPESSRCRNSIRLPPTAGTFNSLTRAAFTSDHTGRWQRGRVGGNGISKRLGIALYLDVRGRCLVIDGYPGTACNRSTCVSLMAASPDRGMTVCTGPCRKCRCVHELRTVVSSRAAAKISADRWPTHVAHTNDRAAIYASPCSPPSNLDSGLLPFRRHDDALVD